MKTVNLTYKFRIYPDKSQQKLLDKHFGCVRYIYNHFLNSKKEQYELNKKSDDYYAQAKSLTNLKKKDEMYWLKEINSQTLQYALRCLDTAYVNFFRGTAQFPKFKSKRKKNTFTVPQFGKLENNKLKLPKFKNGIKIKCHRKIKGEISKITISKTPTGKYFASILTEQEHIPIPKTGKCVGIDLGIKDFVITSDGKKYKNNRYTKKYERKLKKAQQHLSRKQKGSNGYEKQRLKVAKIHEKISNSRLDSLHKISKNIIEEYDVMCIEDLNVKGMVKNRKLSKHILDAGWGNLIRLLEYKAEWNENELIKINRFFPSSKTCHNCGYINQNLNLSDRTWNCESCETTHDRDINASINILSEGLKIFGQGLSNTMVEDKSDFVSKAHPLKPQVHEYMNSSLANT